MVVEIGICNGCGVWLKTAPTEVADEDGRTMCEKDKGTFSLLFGYLRNILGYILKGGET